MDENETREAEALRRDREKAERAEAKEAERLRRDLEKADREAERAAQKEADRARKEGERLDRDRLRVEQEAERRRAEREREAQQAVKEAARQLREAEKAQRAAALAQQQAARAAEKARRQAVRVVGSAGTPVELPPGIAVLWRTPTEGRPGPRPSLTLEQIADAGIALADAEGIDAVSMARLAESLGFTTMSLYRYVSSKDEVLALMSDRAAGRPPVLGPDVGGWRERLELILAVQQPILRAHPWLARTTTVLHAVGPGRLAWMEGMLSALEDTSLSERQKVGAIGLLATHALDQLRVAEELTDGRRTAAVGAADGADESPDLGELIGVLASPASHPALLRAAGAGAFSFGPDDRGGKDGEDGEDSDGLDFGTTLILDGIERLIALASPAA